MAANTTFSNDQTNVTTPKSQLKLKDDPRFGLSGHPLICTSSLLPMVGVVDVFGVRRPQIFIPAMRVDSD